MKQMHGAASQLKVTAMPNDLETEQPPDRTIEVRNKDITPVPEKSKARTLGEFALVVGVCIMAGKSLIAGSEDDRAFIRETVTKQAELVGGVKVAIEADTDADVRLAEAFDDFTAEVDDLGDASRAQAAAINKILERHEAAQVEPAEQP